MTCKILQRVERRRRNVVDVALSIPSATRLDLGLRYE
jgi:hypothetical protein